MIITRLFEWVASAALLGIGLHILALPGAFAESRMSPLLNLVALPCLLGSLYVATAAMRISALYLGRAYRFTVTMRAIGCGIGGLIWLQMATALTLFSSYNAIHTSPVVWLYISIAMGEFVSTFRARADGNTSR